MAELHSLLRMQLSQQGLSEFATPEELVRIWPDLLVVISRNYCAADSYRQALERDLASANHEKKLLSDKVLRLEEDIRYKDGQLKYYVSHDPLTELFNRYEFARKLEAIIQHDTNDTEYGIIHLDLDRFKVINDSCGQEAGDALLREIANLLSFHIKQKDVLLARLGGDEFAILLCHVSEEEAMAVAERIRAAVQKFHFVWEGTSFSLAASIGVLCFDTQWESAQEILSKVDNTCYLAKGLGRNRVCLFEDKSVNIVRHNEEMMLLNEVNNALEENKFCLYAQQIIDLKNPEQEALHYEVLLRMFDSQNHMLLPETFLPIAERYNLMPTLDRWVVSNTCALLNRYPDKLDQIAFCTINLSGQSVADERFHDFLFTTLEKLSLPLNKLCFEITETIAIANLAKATDFIHALKRMGCKFALDDFGIGMSSFAYLKYLPVDFLKIDGVFVKDIIQDEIDYAMVKSINDIGQVMGKKTIAEFVESKEIMAKVEQLGIDYAQGFGIAVPQEFMNLLK